LNNVVNVTRIIDDMAYPELGTFPVSTEADAILLHPLGIRLLTAESVDSITGKIIAQLFVGDTYRLTMQHHSGVELMFKVPSNAQYIPSVGDAVAVRCDLIVPLTS
jgi:hypothetical protein